MNVAIILNRDAGTLRGQKAEDAAARIAKIFCARSHEVTLRLVAGDEVVAAIERACSGHGAGAVVVGGGDGTVSAAAATAARSGTVLGVLPLGTMNFFARSLAIPLDMEQAAAALADSPVESVDLGEVNGALFVHAVSLGLHPRVVVARERLAYRSRYGKMLSNVRAFLHVVRKYRRFAVSIETDSGRFDCRTAGVVVTNNPLGIGHLPYADDLDGGFLAVYVTAARGWWQLSSVVASAALGNLADHPLVDGYETAEAEIRLGKRLTAVTVDGELRRLAGPLKIRSLKGALKVLKPKEPAPTA